MAFVLLPLLLQVAIEQYNMLLKAEYDLYGEPVNAATPGEQPASQEHSFRQEVRTHEQAYARA